MRISNASKNWQVNEVTALSKHCSPAISTAPREAKGEVVLSGFDSCTKRGRHWKTHLLKESFAEEAGKLILKSKLCAGIISRFSEDMLE